MDTLTILKIIGIVCGAMVFGEQNSSEQERTKTNIELAEATRDSVDRLCEDIIDGSFAALQTRLVQDAEAIGLYAAAGFPRDVSVPIYVSQDFLDAPFYEDEPTETLTLLFERQKPIDDSRDEATGDQVRVYLPISRNYVYPQPVGAADRPTEIYMEIIPHFHKHEASTRYIIQPNENDPKQRYAIYEYDSVADGREQVVHDEFSPTGLREALINRIPDDIELASKLIRRLGNFDIIYQGDVGLSSEEAPLN